MSRGKNCLPTVSRQFLPRNYPRPNRLLKCLPNCLSRTGEGIFSSFKITPAVRVIARQLRDKNCLGAIFAPGHQDVSQGPLGWWHCHKGKLKILEERALLEFCAKSCHVSNPGTTKRSEDIVRCGVSIAAGLNMVTPADPRGETSASVVQIWAMKHS